MLGKIIPLSIFILICGLAVFQGLWYYPQLPELVASHFGLSGHPDTWSSKSDFIRLYFLVTAFIAFIFIIISFGIYRLPDSVINIPNKKFWLSPERRHYTFDIISNYILWFGSATLLLIVDIFNQSFRVHLGFSDRLQRPFTSIVIYIVFGIVWLITLNRNFRR